MNSKTLVRISNIIGIISILLLIYWVFTFIVLEVFGLKIFRENITESFNMSILGILALMCGALITNIMFNLTRIAEKDNNVVPAPATTPNRKLLWIFTSSFPVILALLFVGNYLTLRNKERVLISNAQSIIENYKSQAESIVNYQFTEKWRNDARHLIELLSADENFPYVSVVTKDSIRNANVFLNFNRYSVVTNETKPVEKRSLIFESTQQEREYLEDVFNAVTTEIRFSGDDGHYEFFYPYKSKGKIIVFHFTDYQRYGKIGR